MKPEPPNLTGQILLAHPSLRDPNFRRSMVYLARHDPLEGTFGFIINRPTTQKFDALDVETISPLFSQIPLHLGGPVGIDNVLFVMIDWDAFTKTLTVEYTKSPEELDPEKTIATVGYAGWTGGQLEAELAENAWIVLDPADSDGLLVGANSKAWKTLVIRSQPDLKLLVEMPDDPCLN